MKKKLFTLLALTLATWGGVSAQTYNGEEATATFPFNTGGAQEATINVADAFTSSFVELKGSLLSYNGTQVYNSVTYTKIKNNGDKYENQTGNYVRFTITPKKGLTFTPTSVSFGAMRIGTDAGVLNVSVNNKSLKTGIVPGRNNGTQNDGYTFSYDVSDVVCSSENPCNLDLIIASQNGEKDLGLTNIVIKGTVSGTVEQETLWTVTTSVSPAGAGSVIQDPAGTLIADGKKVTFSATANPGYVFLNKWTVDNQEVEGETYTIESLSADVNVVAQFVKNPVVTFAKPADVYCVNRMFPADIVNVEKGGNYTLPNNYMYYKEGYTMTGWDVNGEKKDFGDEITITEDITLTPIFAENKVSLATQRIGATIKYDFNPKENGGRFVNIENNEDKFITTATIDGEVIDVALEINCKDDAGIQGKRGKVNNEANNAETAQINPGAIFTIPVEVGSVITIKGSVDFSSTTFNGATATMDGKKVTYTATEAGNVVVIAGEDKMNYSDITVTYPKHATSFKVGEAGYRTFTSSSALDFTDVEDLTAYRAEVKGDAVKFYEIKGKVPAKEGMLIKAKPGTYYIPLASGTPAAIENAFKGVTNEKGEKIGAGIYVLLNGKDGLAFYRTTDEFTVGANTAYLSIEDFPARSISLPGEGDDDTTGIIVIESEKVADGKYFDLQGRQVSNPTKGLYIYNGKKYIVK